MTRAIMVCAALIASGCAHTVYRATPLPDLPSPLRECAAREGIGIPNGPLSNSQTAALVAALRLSELSGLSCAERIVAWYDRLTGANGGDD